MVLWIGFDSEVRRANNKMPNDRNFCSCPQRTQHLNSRCDLLTEIDMIISVRDCHWLSTDYPPLTVMDGNENQRLVLSRDVCDNHADRSSEKHSEVPKHLHSLLTCHTSSAHYIHSWILQLRNGIWLGSALWKVWTVSLRCYTHSCHQLPNLNLKFNLSS